MKSQLLRNPAIGRNYENIQIAVTFARERYPFAVG